MKVTGFWTIALCSLIEVEHVSEMHAVSTIRVITLIMEAARTSET
jgi:hypothetical protein